MEHGTTQRITVNSRPPDAQVFFDGRLVGVTPTAVAVSRSDREPAIRIWKEGFEPYEPRLERSLGWWAAVAVGTGIIAGYATAIALTGYDTRKLTPLGHVTIWTAAVGAGSVDFLTGAAFEFPRRVDANLVPPDPEWWLREPERDRWLWELDGLREDQRTLARGGWAPIRSCSAMTLKSAAEQPVRSVQPRRNVPLGDVQLASDLGIWATFNVPEPHHLLKCGR